MKDLQGLGTPEEAWSDSGLLDRLPQLDPLDLAAEGRVVLVVPHPDDEVLGASGLLLHLARAGVPVLVIAVTDGEASHPDRAEELRERRTAERQEALAILSSTAEVVRLEHPDGQVDEALLREQLRDLVGPDDVLLSPWAEDGHPDHDACGRASTGLGARAWSYLVWAWHWATPGELPLQSARRVVLSEEDVELKRSAVQAYRSQLEGADPILPPHVTARLVRSYEVLLPA